MSTRRAAALFLCLAMLLTAIFTGCQQTPTTTKTTTGTTSASTAGTTSAATTTAGAAKQISVWCKWKPEDSLTLDAKKFEAENKISVELVVLPDFTEIMRRLQVASASGQKPNIAGVDLIQVPVINKMLELVDLNKFIATDPSINFADFYPALVNYSKLDGKQLALPLETSNIIMYYNKKLFREAGLDPEKPPVTWDDIVEYGIKLTKPGVWGYCFGFHDTYAEALSWQFQIQVWSNGAKTWTDDYTKVLFDSPEAVEALQFWVDCFQVHKICSQNTPDKAFQNGNVAMYEDGSWMSSEYYAALKDDMGACLLPKKKEFATNLGGENIIMFKASDAEEAASWKFINYMTSKTPMINEIIQKGNLPVRKSLDADPALDVMKKNPGYKVAVDALQYAHSRMPIPQYTQLSDIMYEYLQKALYGKMTAKEALDTATKKINDMLAGK